jgi:hypothetical protein
VGTLVLGPRSCEGSRGDPIVALGSTPRGFLPRLVAITVPPGVIVPLGRPRGFGVPDGVDGWEVNGEFIVEGEEERLS